MRARHWLVLGSLALMVLLPLAISIAYLYGRAADQYHSRTAFSVRSEDAVSPFDMLGAFTQSGGGASDADILYEYIASQQMVEVLDARLDLRAIFLRRDGDFVFGLADDAPIEDLVRYWNRMVDVAHDTNTGLIEITVRAFDPAEARAIAVAVLDESSALVNRLSEAARRDAIAFAEQDLTAAEARLRDLRRQISVFRAENRMIDPGADVIGQAGLITALEAQLADALVERGTLDDFASAADPRLTRIDARINAIRSQIEQERARMGSSGPDAGATMTEVISRYEELLVDLEFSQASYTAALAGLEHARAEARRQSRYLAVHIDPTLSQAPQYPRRALLAGLAGLFLLLGWSLVVLVGYHLRDRR